MFRVFAVPLVTILQKSEREKVKDTVGKDTLPSLEALTNRQNGEKIWAVLRH